MNIPESKLTKAQKKSFTKRIDYDGTDADIVAEIRHDDDDDECGNGHNTFAITGTIYKHGRRSDSAWLVGGCIPDEIEKHFPELAQYIKWHLCSTDGPMHYVANTLYHASDKDCWGKSGKKEPDLQAARNSAIWPEAKAEDFTKGALEARLPALLVEFKKAVESLGFVY